MVKDTKAKLFQLWFMEHQQVFQINPSYFSLHFMF